MTKRVVVLTDDPVIYLKVGDEAAVWPLDEGGDFDRSVTGPSGRVIAIEEAD